MVWYHGNKKKKKKQRETWWWACENWSFGTGCLSWWDSRKGRWSRLTSQQDAVTSSGRTGSRPLLSGHFAICSSFTPPPSPLGLAFLSSYRSHLLRVWNLSQRIYAPINHFAVRPVRTWIAHLFWVQPGVKRGCRQDFSYTELWICHVLASLRWNIKDTYTG